MLGGHFSSKTIFYTLAYNIDPNSDLEHMNTGNIVLTNKTMDICILKKKSDLTADLCLRMNFPLRALNLSEMKLSLLAARHNRLHHGTHHLKQVSTHTVPGTQIRY